MKNKIIILIILSISTLVGCYQVTEGDLYEDYKQVVVIEALVNNKKPPYYVKITYSANPTDTVDYNIVRNAKVSISDRKDKLNYLQKISDNIYELDNITGTPDSTYFLDVFIDGVEYKANETMLKPPIIYRTEIKYRDEYVPVSGNYIKLFLNKDKHKVNYYKLDITKNDTLYNTYDDLIIFSDAYAEDTLRYLIPYAFNPKDSVVVDLNIISEDIYKYFYALKKQTINTFSNIQTPLKNPPNSIVNNPLGCFQVSAVTTIDIVIPDTSSIVIN
jgi:hypothetical protein